MTPLNKLRILIAEDEILARERVRRLLKSERGFEIVAEAGDGAEAVALSRRHRPEILLLDVQLRGMNGFEVIASLGGDAPTAIIFLTAHREHAVRAFDARAVDYLLKPVSPERLSAALVRARTICESPAKWIHQLGGKPNAAQDRIAVRSGAASLVVLVTEILYAEAAGTRCRITTRHDVFLISESLSSLFQRLPARQFARVSRFAVVNLAEVTALRPKSNGDQRLSMTNGMELVLTRTRRLAVMNRLGRSA